MSWFFTGLHEGIVGSDVSVQQGGPGFGTHAEVFIHRVCIFYTFYVWVFMTEY